MNVSSISNREVAALSRVVGHVAQGNYWLDSAGNLGKVGEEAFGNVHRPRWTAIQGDDSAREPGAIR